MTTQEIAKRYTELANQSQWNQILDELHDEDALCREPAKVAERGLAVETQGKAAIKAKGEGNRARIEEIHSQFCSEPLVAGNVFSVVLKRDVTFKNMPRTQLQEIGVFEVKDGKIILEQFFF